MTGFHTYPEHTPSTDTALEQAMTFVLHHRYARAARLPVVGDGRAPDRTLDLSWVPPRWWKAVTGSHRRDVPVVTVDRRYLELCVLSCVMLELKSGDLCIAGSEHFSDYRDQLVTWEEYAQQVETYCQRVGIAADPTQFAHDLQRRLAETIRTTDTAFPTNTALTSRFAHFLDQFQTLPYNSLIFRTLVQPDGHSTARGWVQGANKQRTDGPSTFKSSVISKPCQMLKTLKKMSEP